MKQQSEQYPLMPLEVRFDRSKIDDLSSFKMDSVMKMKLVKSHIIGAYGLNFFIHLRRRDYLAPRAAFLVFFANKYRLKEPDDHRLYDGITLAQMGEIVGGFDHCVVLHHLKNHESNMADYSTNFGDYYRNYYKLTHLIYMNMFEKFPTEISKRMLVGAL